MNEWSNFEEDDIEEIKILFAEPQELLRGHLSQNQFQPGDFDALLPLRHKKSQRMLIFPKWDWWKSKLLKVLKTRATGSWLEWTQWLVIPHRSCKWVQSSFLSPSSFLCNPVFVVFDEILYSQNAIFTLNVYNGQSQSVPGAFTDHVLFWECWNDDWHCIIENTSSP